MQTIKIGYVDPVLWLFWIKAFSPNGPLKSYRHHEVVFLKSLIIPLLKHLKISFVPYIYNAF